MEANEVYRKNEVRERALVAAHAHHQPEGLTKMLPPAKMKVEKPVAAKDEYDEETWWKAE